MEVLAQALAIVMRPDVLAALAAGTVGGVIIGAVPGIGAAVAIAILLPATFAMDPIVGLTLLLGVYGSSMFGGAIPAILINTPGTPVNALTTYDGYPMTQRGEAPRALALAYGASFCGGILSVGALLVLAPVLASIAPMFGSREIFLTAVLGMILVVVTHRRHVLVSAALLFLGIFINTIGLEPVFYTQRYTFGQTWLTSGIDLIVVVLGLFAISQAFLLLTGKDDTPKPPRLEGGMLRRMFEVLRYPKVLLPGAGFGIVMGIIPGLGEFMAQFFSYSLARRTAKDPSMMGRGAPEGIVASEVANNSVPAAAMIPLLALGIPGEELTAMMLSVFYVHNVIPGPALFRDQPDFIAALYINLAILNVLAVIFLLAATRPLLKIIEFPNRFLGMMVLTLSFVGVYTLRNSFTDCAVAGAFGLFGLMLRRLGWPSVPIIFGIILGGIAENKLRTSLPRIESPLDWINRPVAAVIFGLIVLVLAVHCWTVWRDWRPGTEARP